MPTPEKREKPAYVTYTRPRCPRCGSVRLRTYSRRKDPWGLTRYAICQECQRHIVLTEQ